MLPRMDAMTRKASEIRAAVRGLGVRGAGRRYPEAIKRDALAYLAERREAGRGYSSVSVELGIPRRSLKLWSAAPRPSGSARFVAVTLMPSEATLPSRIVVHGPGGLRIEGLDLAGLADLVRRLA